MQEKIEVSQEELIEVVKRLSSEIVVLRCELQEAKQEIKRLRRWVGQVSEFAIKKSIK